jgi:hypothetical protein
MALLATGTSNVLERLGVSALSVVLAGEVVRTAAVGFLMRIGRQLLPAAHPARMRGPALVLPAALAAQTGMIGTFLAARPRTARDWSLAVSGRSGRLLLSAHDGIFALYTILVLAEIVCGLHRESLRVSRGPLRLGTRLMLAAACVGVLWAAWTVDDIVDVLRSNVQNGSEDAVSNVLGAVCAALVVSGATVTRWDDAWAAPLRWYHVYRAYAALGPLWKALQAHIPEISLAESRRRLHVASPSYAAFALYRRVIEIDDARLALRPYTPSRATVAALIDTTKAGCSPASAGPEDVDDSALIEAASIAAALTNLGSGRKIRDGDRDEPAEPDQHDHHERGGVETEAAWLARVSKEFSHSPVLQGALARLNEIDRCDGTTRRHPKQP